MRGLPAAALFLIACDGDGTGPGTTPDAACANDLGRAPAWTKNLGFGAFPSSVAISATGRIAVRGHTAAGPVDFGDGPLTGAVDDGFIAVFEADGTPAWSKRHPQYPVGTSGNHDDILFDHTGRVIVEGDSDGATDLGGGAIAPGLFITALAADGSFGWTWSRPNGTNHGEMKLAVDATGAVYEWDGGALFKLVDGVQQKLESESNLSTRAGFPVRYSELAVGGDGSVFFVWQKPVLVTEFSAAKLAAADWARAYSVTYPNREIEPTAARVDAAGNLVVVGRFEGIGKFGAREIEPVDANLGTFVVSIDPAGTTQWAHGYKGRSTDWGAHVGIASDRGVLVHGQGDAPFALGGAPHAGCGSPSTANYVVALDGTGEYRWSSIDRVPGGVAGAGGDGRIAVAEHTAQELVLAVYGP